MPRKRKSPSPGYANRTDKLQPVQAPSGRPYGARQQLEQAQAEAPLPDARADFAQVLAAAQQFQLPPTVINGPTQAPDEPLTAGIPSGPGPGPEALGPMFSPEDDPAMALRALYQRYPVQEILELIEELDEA